MIHKSDLPHAGRCEVATVPRDAEGRKMYPGRFWEWPNDLPPIDTYEGEMEYGIAVWSETNDKLPTVRQIKYALFLLDTRMGADPSKLDWSSKRYLGRGINEMLKLPEVRR